MISDRITVLNNVFWDPRDTISLRNYIYTSNAVNHKTVFEIGTGTGLIALCCADRGASKVIASDINPWAVKNAKLNAVQLGYSDIISIRQVSESNQDIWSVMEPDERFDIIVTNPPWEMGEPEQWIDYAFFDHDFRLIHSLMKHFTNYLNPSGKLLLAYGCVEAIEEIIKLSKQYGYTLSILDDRSFDGLDVREEYRYDKLHSVFMPGMLLEIRP